MGRKVLIACANHWWSPLRVGSHHFAARFAEADWEVAFVSAPLSPFHAVRGLDEDLRRRFAVYRTGGETDLDGRLWAYVPAALLVPANQPVLRTSWVYRSWPAWSWPNVLRVVVRRGFGEPDLVMLDDLRHASWVGRLRTGLRVLRLSDYHAGFTTVPAAEQHVERDLARSVDLVVYAARSMEGYVSALHPRAALRLPNGVDFARFAEGGRDLPEEYRGIARPIVVYVGAMEQWFDFELVREVASRLPEMSFVLIGPARLARQKLQGSPNIHLLGPRSHAALPPYLHNADVGIIPFDVRAHSMLVNHVNPLKLLEYMACGLPVVATSWQELRLLGTPAVLADGAEEFAAALRSATASAPARDRHVRYAADHDWSRSFSRLIQVLGLESRVRS